MAPKKNLPSYLAGSTTERILYVPSGHTGDKSGTPGFVERNARWITGFGLIALTVIYVLAQSGR